MTQGMNFCLMEDIKLLCFNVVPNIAHIAMALTPKILVKK